MGLNYTNIAQCIFNSFEQDNITDIAQSLAIQFGALQGLLTTTNTRHSPEDLYSLAYTFVDRLVTNPTAYTEFTIPDYRYRNIISVFALRFVNADTNKSLGSCSIDIGPTKNSDLILQEICEQKDVKSFYFPLPDNDLWNSIYQETVRPSRIQTISSWLRRSSKT